ncbi:hypothetical protein Gorai_023444 [Gossypium raimondii]|uniref:Myosin motor domain-containing protein n=1 Tax=Gossypium raimondii TaxID=29730 RepID=A0A7J8NW57_GOSRA|nr:hypothetical protein [Gossypium raimondii]
MPGGRLMVNCGGVSESSLDGKVQLPSIDDIWMQNSTIKALAEAFPGQQSFPDIRLLLKPSWLRCAIEELSRAIYVHALELNAGNTMHVKEQEYDLLDPMYDEYSEESENVYVYLVEGMSSVVHRITVTTSEEVVDPAYRQMINKGISLAILVSGENGVGKYLAYMGGRVNNALEQSVEQNVLESNPALEAFGNTKTVRKNSSSRLGKIVVIQFHHKGMELQ